MVIQGTCLGDVDWLNFQVIVLPVVLNNRQQSWFQSIHFGKQVSPSVTSQRSSIALWIWGSEGLLEKQEGMPWVSGAHRPPESIRCSDTTLWFHGLQHARLPCPSLSPGACLDSCPLSWWCYLTISTPVTPFSSCLQSFPASRSFPMCWLSASGAQSIGASASVLPMNIQGWIPLGLTGLISLQPKGLSRVFFNTTVQNHQFFTPSALFIVQLSHP